MNPSIKTNPTKFLLALLALHFILRLPTFYTPILDIDEAQFAGFAHVLMDGGLPFRDSLDTKPLGIYWFYQLVFEVFGRTNMNLVHVGTALLIFAGGIFLERGLSALGLRREGRISALLLVVFSTTFIPKYLSTSINSIMIVFLCGSFFALCHYLERRSAKHLLLAGFFSGLAFLLKYTAGIQLIFFGIFSLLQSYKHQSLRGTQLMKAIIKQNLLFGLGFAVPFALHGLYLMKLGVWGDFVNWSITGSSRYVAQGVSTINPWLSFISRFGSYVLATLPIWIYGAQTFFAKTSETPHRKFFSLWFVLSLVPVFVGARFYPHYFLHVLPSLCVLASLSIAKAIPDFSWKDMTTRTRVLMTYSAIVTLMFLVLRLDHRLYLEYFPDDQLYEQQRIGLALKKMSHPGDRAFVWGFATSIYFYSELKPASRFLWSDLLTGRTPGPEYARRNLDLAMEHQNPAAWIDFMADLNTNKPRFFIDTSPANIHGYGQFPLSRYPQLQSYIEINYTKVENLEGVDVYERKLMTESIL